MRFDVAENRDKIISTYVARKDIDHFAKAVSNTDIAANEYNLGINSYVEQENTDEIIDIEHLNARIAEIVIKQNHLRIAINDIVADLEGAIR